MTKRIVIALIAAALVILILAINVTVVPINSGSTVGNVDVNSENFDPQAYIDSIFQTEAVPVLKDKAIDINEVMTAANGDLKSVGEKYGVRADSGNAYNFLVKGTAAVKEVNTSLRAGYAILTLDGYTGSETFKMQVGPVFKGTAIRDCMPMIKFDDFKNQVVYANLATAIHVNLSANLFKTIDASTLAGKTIEFYGAFTDNGSTEIVITPFAIEVK
ncbi:MAG: DUF2291 domain-containing protein [Eubacteriales bacterium]